MILMYKIGTTRVHDFLLCFLVGVYILLQQYAVFWKGYGYIWCSYHKYLMKPYAYTVVNAEVLNVTEHLLAGVQDVLYCSTKICRVKYEYKGRTFYETLEDHPDVKMGDTIEIAIDDRNPMKIKRIHSYSLWKYHWITQFFLFVAEILYYHFVCYVIDYYRYNEPRITLKKGFGENPFKR